MIASLRQATPDDARAIHALVSAHVGENRLLPRMLSNIQRSIDSWIVAEEENELVGCGSLISFGKGLSEVRSLVVDSRYQRNGLGGQIVRELIELAEGHGVKTLFTLTTAVKFFERQGFVSASRRNFPLKIYRDCLKCPAKFRCDEVTMVYQKSELDV
jgi:amino-acid N-acetyltransferase